MEACGPKFWIGYVSQIVSRRKGMSAVNNLNSVQLSDIPSDLMIQFEWLEPCPHPGGASIYTTPFLSER